MEHTPVNWSFHVQKSFRIDSHNLEQNYCCHHEDTQRAFQSNHNEKVRLCDSQVTLFGIYNQDNPAKQLVQN